MIVVENVNPSTNAKQTVTNPSSPRICDAWTSPYIDIAGRNQYTNSVCVLLFACRCAEQDYDSLLHREQPKCSELGQVITAALPRLRIGLKDGILGGLQSQICAGLAANGDKQSSEEWLLSPPHSGAGREAEIYLRKRHYKQHWRRMR